MESSARSIGDLLASSHSSCSRALRAKIGAARAVRLLADCSRRSRTRASARARLAKLGGPRGPSRRGRLDPRALAKLLLGAALIVVAANLLTRTVKPGLARDVLAVVIAMDVRWRAMVADVVDQLRRRRITGCRGARSHCWR